MKKSRPFLLWLLCLIFLGFASVYLLQVIQTIKSWNILLAIQYQLGPVYPLIQGVFFVLGFLTATTVLWARISWAPAFDATIVTMASICYWVDRIFLTQNPQPIKNSLFALIFFLILLILVNASLWTLKPYMKLKYPEGKEIENES